MHKSDITGKIVLQGKLKLITALKIASGNDELTDADVLLDSKGLPYIPGSSLAGVLKEALSHSINKTDLIGYWGKGNNEGSESNIDFSSCMADCTDVALEVRDSIAINPATNQNLKGAKFDFQIVPAGISFNYRIILNVIKDKTIAEEIASLLCQLLENGFSLGGKTTRGLGKVKGECPNHRIFDFNKAKHVYNWIDRDYINGGEIFNPDNNYKITQPYFKIEADFFIPNSLIIGSYNPNKATDKEHLKSGGKDILTGTSLAGAFRASARMIANTIGIKDSEEIIKKLFGTVELNSNNATRSKVFISENIIEGANNSVLQHRIKADRFTGGTVDGAKFDSTPLFGGTIRSISIVVKKENDVEKAHIGLLLLAFADLWRGDIAIGGEKNAGRGIIKGRNGIITLNNETYNLDNSEEIKKLDTYITEELKKLKEPTN